MVNRRMTHLLKIDADLFRQYLDAFPDRYRTLEYDIHVGTGRDPGTTFSKSMRNMAITLSQRRIDAIGFMDDRIDIIEITQTADLKALGQLLAYPRLFRQAHHPTVPLFPVLVARKFATDVEDSFAEAGVESYLFPE